MLIFCLCVPHLVRYYHFYNLISSFTKLCTGTHLSVMALFGLKPLFILLYVTLFCQSCKIKCWWSSGTIWFMLFSCLNVCTAYPSIHLTAYCKYHSVLYWYTFSTFARIKVSVERLTAEERAVMLNNLWGVKLVRSWPVFFVFFSHAVQGYQMHE